MEHKAYYPDEEREKMVDVKYQELMESKEIIKGILIYINAVANN